MDTASLVEGARAASAHHWAWTRLGLSEACADLGWEVVGHGPERTDLLTPLGPAFAMSFGEELVFVEWQLMEPREADPDDVAGVESAAFAVWDEATRALAEALGPPTFADGRSNPGYPADEEGAEWLARWPLSGGGRLCVKALHEDAGLPWRVALVVDAPAEA